MNCLLLLTALLGLEASAEPSSAAPSWKPAAGPLATRWTGQVDPARVHPEYPRPQMVRPEWTNLNGLWDYAIRAKSAERPDSFDGKILVPFPVESALSGVMKAVRPTERLWYRRTFPLAPAPGRRWLLHFGAVDWSATVFLNGKKLGEHLGGYDPFTLDITAALEPAGTQELVVSVWDPTDSEDQPRGKQVLKPGGIMYTANTGIWQTVWLEAVPETWIDHLILETDLNRGEIRITPRLSGPSDRPLRAEVLDEGRPVGAARGNAGATLTVRISDPKAWSPARPFLYGLKVGIEGGDEVRSYVGLRTISLGPDASGFTRLLLNGKPLFQLGLLDQGWWPDGLYTAPSDEALKYDIEVTRRLGFNMIRKHVKVEPARWYYWCDVMGVLVWQDMPSGNNRTAPARTQFAQELERMIDALRNHPSIVIWVPFNEGWGQHDTPRYVEAIKKQDPSRLVNNASGWTDSGTGDVSDVHSYPGPGMPPVEKGRAAVLGEFGGLGLPMPGHLWLNKDNWGYRSFKDQAGLARGYFELIAKLRGFAAMGLSAAVYTQTTDCEVEVNGLMTYDRAVIKVPVELAASAHRTLYGSLPVMKELSPTARQTPQTWRYTIRDPGTGWFTPEYADAAWTEGESGFGTKQTPGARVKTEWTSSDIWIRRSFELGPVPPSSPHLFIHHDEDAEVYLNGELLVRLQGFTTDYELVPVGADKLRAFRPGRNVLAVHCRQTAGGQYIDVGLVDLVNAPASAASAEGSGTPQTYQIARPPAEPGLSPFYAKYISAGGLPVVGSSRVSDHALKEAAYLVDRMLAHRPDVREALIRNKVRCAVMAYSERTTDIPEHSDLTPRTYWNVRARGLGATSIRPAVSGAEENLLNYPGDPYDAENILIHEFGHAMHEMGMNSVDPTFNSRLGRAYRRAKDAGLWKGTYAETNPSEYWAEGVQSWFDTNRENDFQHNHVNTREELKAHDPALAALLVEVFGDGPWRYQRPAQRTDKAHLAGYDPSRAPRFVWEAELLEAQRQLRREPDPRQARDVPAARSSGRD